MSIPGKQVEQAKQSISFKIDKSFDPSGGKPSLPCAPKLSV